MNFFNIPTIENDEYIYSYVLRLATYNWTFTNNLLKAAV